MSFFVFLLEEFCLWLCCGCNFWRRVRELVQVVRELDGAQEVDSQRGPEAINHVLYYSLMQRSARGR